MRPALEEELMDRPDLPRADTERALADIERVHRLSGIGAVRRALAGRLPAGRVAFLDLGTGTGHVPARLARLLARRGVELAVVGVDRKLSHLVIGRDRGVAQLRVVADADALPFRASSFEAVLSTLFFHHFDETENRSILDEMRRVARNCAVVVDLRRSRLGQWVARVAIAALRLGPVATYDGRLSVDQAWSLGEVRALVGDDEIVELERRWPFRFSLVVRG